MPLRAALQPPGGRGQGTRGARECSRRRRIDGPTSLVQAPSTAEPHDTPGLAPTSTDPRSDRSTPNRRRMERDGRQQENGGFFAGARPTVPPTGDMGRDSLLIGDVILSR